jgi:hypothetical protein
MATDAQKSAPLVGENFTDEGWRAAFAGQTGVVGDYDGSAFGISLPTEGANVEIGSATQPSRLVVDGFGLEVPQGETQSLEIPASSGGGTNGRTDLIVARLDMANFTTAPGPVRLHRVAGVEGSLTRPAPSYDADGVRDLPLYAVRRRQGESLNQAIVTDLRPRVGLSIVVPSGATLPDAPLGTRATRDGVTYRRDMVSVSAQWVEEYRERVVLTGLAATASASSGWQRQSSCRMERVGPERDLTLVVTRGPGASTINTDARGAIEGSAGPVVGLVTLHDQDKPPAGTLIPMIGRVLTVAGNPFTATGVVSSTGNVSLIATAPNISLAWSAAQEKGAEILLKASWSRA